MLYGAIEAGGTKFVCAVGNEKLDIIEKVNFTTLSPKETMPQVISFFKKYETQLSSIAIGSFGPIDICPDSKTYGYITSTPKISWQNFDFIGYLKTKLKEMPLYWTTDVNAAAYGEYIDGHGQGYSSVVYYTVGTGIGGGALQNGKFIEGFSHPEMGHMIVRNHPNDYFKGNCPYHQNCLEGMAAGPAIEKRIGIKGQDLPEDHPFWEIEAFYVAQCIYNTTMMFSPDIIILGGGVMKQVHLQTKIHHEFKKIMNNYVDLPTLEKYIVFPKLGDQAGIIGCLGLAKKIASF
ncbi:MULTISPECIES: ROK family protein [Enterococcus]|uniref:ROK family protein n=2 Tax=Enterococcus TaxID=1350 RepID=UPI0003F982E9|nr:MULTISPECIES: ROK family protein [Enterococcus]EGP4849405.1 ROK family protein [Enterococcus faecium]KEI52197.1 fructokinase [Enterococcus faecium UC8733]MBH0818256.1 ROK family protein [Enterococcus faecium]MDQ8346266.1 ROK family protein [Enterococcus faecium]MDQ8374043.1 ROK family protein [Enterococcus faecium]